MLVIFAFVLIFLILDYPVGVKNFVQHGKAQLPEEEEFDPENMFANRRRAPTGPKREPGEGFTTELPKNSE